MALSGVCALKMESSKSILGRTYDVMRYAGLPIEPKEGENRDGENGKKTETTGKIWASTPFLYSVPPHGLP